MTRLLAVLALVSVVLFIPGCGDGDESAGMQLTKKAFTERASMICEKAEKEALEKAVAFVKKHPSSQEAELVEPVLIPALEKQAQQIGALGVPKSDEAAVNAILEEFEEALGRAKRDPQALLQPSTNPFKPYNQLAKDYGLIKCSRVP